MTAGFAGNDVNEAHKYATERFSASCWRSPRQCMASALVPLSVARCAEGTVELKELTLAFDVSSDEEDVRLTLLWDQGRIDLGERVHHYLLLTLARARLDDLEKGVPDRAAGWVHAKDWEHDEAFRPHRVNLYVHRIRRQLAGCGVRSFHHVVERRERTRQMRIGPTRFLIER